MGLKKCQVCEEAQSKYKCPTCLIAYCSLGCFKKHKEVPCQKAESVKEEKIYPSSTTNDDRPSYVDEQSEVLEEIQLQSIGEMIFSVVIGTRQRTKIVVLDVEFTYFVEHIYVSASSNEIRDLVKNEHLQKLIYNIDSSANPENELDKALQEESFRLFTEKILSTIAPDA